jgi:PucR family transcriptional regulator, purine catabolism regulatory protein
VGYPVQGRQFVGLVVRPRIDGRTPADLREVAADVVRAAHGLRLPLLVCEIERDLCALVSVAAESEADPLLDRLAQRIARPDVAVAAGRAVLRRSEIATTLLEATQVADALPVGGNGPGPGVHRLADVHLRGLLSLFGPDERLRLFVDRELAPLKAHDRSQGSRTELLAALRALLNHPSSKTEAASSLHLSRAAFYDRVAKIEEVLGVDLDDADVRVSLHVALIADELSRQHLRMPTDRRGISAGRKESMSA